MYNGLIGQKLLGEVLEGKTDAALPVVGGSLPTSVLHHLLLPLTEAQGPPDAIMHQAASSMLSGKHTSALQLLPPTHQTVPELHTAAVNRNITCMKLLDCH